MPSVKVQIKSGINKVGKYEYPRNYISLSDDRVSEMKAISESVVIIDFESAKDLANLIKLMIEFNKNSDEFYTALNKMFTEKQQINFGGILKIVG